MGRTPYPGERNSVPILQEAVWDPEPVWVGAEIISPPGIRSPERPVHTQSQ
jgi:hypothetical protein